MGLPLPGTGEYKGDEKAEQRQRRSKGEAPTPPVKERVNKAEERRQGELTMKFGPMPMRKGKEGTAPTARQKTTHGEDQ